jgi:hypothetical protein
LNENLAFVYAMVLDTSKPLPSLSYICSFTQSKFHHHPCLWQAKAVKAILKHDRDVIIITGMGMGKTLTFWMPLLFYPAGHIQVVITPLNLLGKCGIVGKGWIEGNIYWSRHGYI